jgi:hypothetical protein
MTRKRWDEVLDRVPPAATVVEVGVWKGDLAVRLLKARPALRMVLVDPWLAGAQHPSWAASGAELATRTQAELDAIYAGVVEAVRPYGDRARILRLPSVDAAGLVADGSCDAVFLDAEHTRTAVMTDIAAWRPKVRPGGWIGGHDYGHPRFPGVQAAVEASVVDVTQGHDRTWFAPVGTA